MKRTQKIIICLIFLGMIILTAQNVLGDAHIGITPGTNPTVGDTYSAVIYIAHSGTGDLDGWDYVRLYWNSTIMGMTQPSSTSNTDTTRIGPILDLMYNLGDVDNNTAGGVGRRGFVSPATGSNGGDFLNPLPNGGNTTIWTQEFLVERPGYSNLTFETLGAGPSNGPRGLDGGAVPTSMSNSSMIAYPRPPAGLAGVAGGEHYINLTWNAMADCGERFVLYEGGSVIYNGTGTGYNHGGLTQGTTYNYYLWVYNGTATTGPSGTNGMFSLTNDSASVATQATAGPNTAPVNSAPSPGNAAGGQSINPTLLITINDADGDTMSVTWMTNATGSWSSIGTDNGGNSTQSNPGTGMSSYNSKYFWSVNTSDGNGGWDNDTYYFYTGSNSPPSVTTETPTHGTNITETTSTTLQVIIADGDGDSVTSGWIECNVEGVIDNQSISGAPGTYTNPISGLIAGNEYTWYVNVTDGAAASGSWNRYKYTFNVSTTVSYTVTQTLTNLTGTEATGNITVTNIGSATMTGTKIYVNAMSNLTLAAFNHPGDHVVVGTYDVWTIATLAPSGVYYIENTWQNSSTYDWNASCGWVAVNSSYSGVTTLTNDTIGGACTLPSTDGDDRQEDLSHITFTIGGQPLVGAQVSFGGYILTTDANGKIDISGVPYGNYVLTITHPEYGTFTDETVTIPLTHEVTISLPLSGQPFSFLSDWYGEWGMFGVIAAAVICIIGGALLMPKQLKGAIKRKGSKTKNRAKSMRANPIFYIAITVLVVSIIWYLLLG